MAFECQELGVSFLSSKKSLDSCDNPCEQKVSLTQFESCDTKIFKFNSENVNQKSVTLEPSFGCHPGKGATSSDYSEQFHSNDSATKTGRSITDLPPALVSEILQCLGPKELGIVSCVSKLLYNVANEHHGWKEFYCERWGLPLDSIPAKGLERPEERSWKELFVERDFRSKTFMGRYSIDVLYGHTEAVRAVCLLFSAKLIFTGGYDSVIRMWDIEGLSIASSRPLGCTIRAVAADTKLLLAGGTDGFLQCWRAVEGLPHLFDLPGCQNADSIFRLWEHEGPVTCLALDHTKIYSGSWDMTVRIWDRSVFQCMKVLRHGDWIWSLVPRDSTVASSSGGTVYIWDTNAGTLLTVIQNAHVGNTYSLARSHTGNLLFTGGEDGAIHMFEIKNHCCDCHVFRVATWIPHTGPVHSLAFEYPWLVSASSDGKLSLIDVRKLLKVTRHASLNESPRKSFEAPQRMIHGFSCNLFAVNIGADRIVCGGEEGAVRVWNFSQALEIEQRVRALKGIRLENRMRRRKIQLEMNKKGGRTDQCSYAATNQMNGNRGGVWHNKRGVSGKLKA